MDLSTTLFILCLSLILNLFLGFFVLSKNKTNPINISFFFFVIGMVGWGASIFTLLSYGANLITARLTFSFAAMMLASFLLFSIKFPTEKNKSKLFYPSAFLGIIFFTLPLIGNSIVRDVSVVNNFITINFGRLYWLYVIFAPFCIINSLAIIIRKYINSRSVQRLQFKYLFLGGSLFLIPAVMTNLLLPTLFNIWQFNGLGPSFSFFMVAAIAYAIVRYHLMDIWVVVRLGVVFTILTTIISFIYILIVNILGHIISPTSSYIVYSMIIAIGFIPLKNFIEFATDKIFFQKRYKFTDVISQLENVIHQSGLDLDKILDGINDLVLKSIKVKGASILILTPRGYFSPRKANEGTIEETNLSPDNPIISYLKLNKGHIIDIDTFRPDSIKKNNLADAIKELSKTGFSFAVPIENRDELVGIHLLKHKLSLDPFTKEDIRLLKHISTEMAFSIDNAKMFEELQKLDRAKSEFISVVSHQLRTPVSIIKWNLELIFDKKTPNNAKNELMGNVYGSIDTIGQHLDKLMTALEIEDKHILVDKKKNCLKSLISGVLKNLKNEFDRKGIDIETDFAGELPPLEFDFDKISKSVVAIVQNAITYTPNGGKIKIGWRNKQINNKDCVVVYISDSGIGIDDRDCINIFKKFFRSHEAQNASPDGFGLGLFIAKKFINAHGGDVWFESQGENSGTTFYFSIPI